MKNSKLSSEANFMRQKFMNNRIISNYDWLSFISGAYSQSTGVDIIRKHVAEFIERRDGIPCDYENVLLSGGASEAIRVIVIY